jgi:tetratricopeptide (TPR) repeat protein
MMQKDYILRMIQQLSRVLIHVLHLREVKDYDGALTYIDDVFKQALGFSSDLINSVPDETLLAMLTSFDVLDIEKCFLVANLLKAEGDIYVDQGDFDTSYYRYLRSLYLFFAILFSDNSINDPDIFVEIEGLLDKLEDYDLPVEIKSQLFQYYERTGRYSRAEDVLFELLEEGDKENEPESNLVEQGIAFYERLLRKKDTELVAGNFSWEEVREGLAQLKNGRLDK